MSMAIVTDYDYDYDYDDNQPMEIILVMYDNDGF